MTMNKKFIAVYYPQFYRIEENDKAWGDGFTDWERIKAAKPLFEGHYQPRIPLNLNYYDQSLKHTISEQVKLALEYGVYGFCFYHYWFDGKLLLEKPMENFLENKDLNIKFCISWANETWSKRWVGQPNYIIQQQTHKPDKAIWKMHFDYLLQFFLDERYIRVDNKPIFIIYQTDIINQLPEMIDYWNSLAIQSGLGGIFFIATKRHKKTSSDIVRKFDGIMKYQPQEAFNSYKTSERSSFSRLLSNLSFYFPEKARNWVALFADKRKGISKPNSAIVWKSIIENAFRVPEGFNAIIFESIFVNWDNSPRYNNKANVFSFVTPEEFGNYLKQMLSKMDEFDAEYLFINAWNEWAEGAYLEPDTKYRFDYLRVLLNSIENE